MLNYLVQTVLFVLLLIPFTGQPKLTEAYASNATVHTAAPARDKEENHEFIPWAPERRLNWDDFLCEPKRNTDAVASTSTALGIAYQVKDFRLTYQITCNFSKVNSWGSLKTPYILAHEQGHFDITEIYARKLNQALRQYKFNKRTYRDDINDIYQKIVKEKEDFQNRYDEETDHSRKKGLQRDWLKRIDNLLADTAPYAAYP